MKQWFLVAPSAFLGVLTDAKEASVHNNLHLSETGNVWFNLKNIYIYSYYICIGTLSFVHKSVRIHVPKTSKLRHRCVLLLVLVRFRKL